MSKQLRILCALDDGQHTKEILQQLRIDGWSVEHRQVTTQDDVRMALLAESWDLIVSDYSTAHLSAHKTLELLESRGVLTPLIVVAGPIGEERVATLMRAGAADFVLRGQWARFTATVRAETQKMTMRVERRRATDERMRIHATMEHELDKRNKELHKLNAMLRDEVGVRRQVEASVRESELRFRSMADGTPVMIWVHDETGRIQFVNHAYCEFFGVTEEQVKSDKWQVLVHQDDQAAYVDSYMRALQVGEPFYAQGRVRRHDGEWRWVESYGQPRFEADRFVGMAGSSVDVTDRRLAEKALQESEERLRLAHKASRDVVWDWDIVLDTQQWNEAGEVVFGWTDIIERPQPASWWVERVHPDDRQRVESGFFAVVNSPKASYWQDEYRFRRADGSFADVMDRGYVVRDTHGKATRMIGAMLDITERKTAQEALLQSEERYRQLVQHAPLGIYRTTPDGQILMGNPALVRMLGFDSFEELAARNLEKEGFEPNYSRLQFIERMETDGEVSGLEAAWTKRDGRIIYVRENARAFRDERGRTTYYEGIVEDITERIVAEAALRQSRQKYQALIETTSDFIWEIDAQGRYTYCSPQMEILWDIKPDEMLGKTPFDKMPLEQKTRALAMFGELAKSASPFTGIELESFDGHGRLIFVEASGVPFFDTDGKLLGYRGVSRDITQRKRIERVLEHERALLQSMMQATDVMLVYLDPEFNFVFVNQPYAATCGMTPEQMVGKNHFALYPNEENEQIFRQVRNTGEQVYLRDKPFVFPDQPERGITYWDWSLVPVKAPDGQVSGLVFSLRETTKYVEALRGRPKADLSASQG